MINLYELLGVNRDATPEEIKKAYRKKAMSMHPDKGGDEKEFKQIVVAYSILSNEDKRRRYDQGENPEDLGRPTNEENAALKMVIEVFLQIVAAAPSVSNLDLFRAVREQIRSTMREIEKEKSKIIKAVEKLNRVKNRVKSKTSENVFAQAIDAQVHKANLDIGLLDKQFKIGQDGIKILEDYNYDFEVMNSLHNITITINGDNFFVNEGDINDRNR